MTASTVTGAPRYVLRRASAADVDVVSEMLTDRAAWLRGKGHDQWSEKDPARTTPHSIARGETWVLIATGAGSAVGTMTMNTTADLDFWTPDELAVPALYLSKLATRPELAGRGLGAMLIYAALRYGQTRGLATMRWDVWRTNHMLKGYYKRFGSQLVREMNVPGRSSGTLFEWAHRAMPADLDAVVARLLRVEAPTGPLRGIDSELNRHLTLLGESDAGGWRDPCPDHWHTIPGLTAGNLYATPPAAIQPVTVSPWEPGPLLFHSGDTWRARGMWAHPVAGDALADLVPGRVYCLAHEVTQTGCRVAVVGDIIASADASPGLDRKLLAL